jgi:subtilisin family serine protease
VEIGGFQGGQFPLCFPSMSPRRFAFIFSISNVAISVVFCGAFFFRASASQAGVILQQLPSSFSSSKNDFTESGDNGFMADSVSPIASPNEIRAGKARPFAIPLSRVRASRNAAFVSRQFGHARDDHSRIVSFAPQTILVKFRHEPGVLAIRVQADREVESLHLLQKNPEVEFAELDLLKARQFEPNDVLVSNQWHHAVIDSYSAWNVTTGNPSIRIGIVDKPFQMGHPDLAANTDAGWSVVTNTAIVASAGEEHSTLAAGMAAAVLNNGIGGAGAANCRLVPIDINGFISEMYDAVVWAADHGIRVVNLSWQGADSEVLNEAGLYLETHARGLLVMSGENGGFQDYPNLPHIWCVSMTDAANNVRSSNGDHIDFAAPGYQIFTTTINSGYTTANGTSFSAPLVAGVVAALLSINPTLSPEETIDLLKATATDLGQLGWDRFYGFGLVNFGKAARAAQATLPSILKISRQGTTTTVESTYREGLSYSLWKSDSKLSEWQLAAPTPSATNGTIISFEDVSSLDSVNYRVSAKGSAVP